MFQAWVVQEFNGKPLTVVLGYKYPTKERATQAVKTYVQYFGTCKSASVEPSGTEIPLHKEKKKSLLETIREILY